MVCKGGRGRGCACAGAPFEGPLKESSGAGSPRCLRMRCTSGLKRRWIERALFFCRVRMDGLPASPSNFSRPRLSSLGPPSPSPSPVAVAYGPRAKSLASWTEVCGCAAVLSQRRRRCALSAKGPRVRLWQGGKTQRAQGGKVHREAKRRRLPFI